MHGGCTERYGTVARCVGGMQRVCGGVWMVAVIAFFSSVFISLLMICNNYELAKNKSQLITLIIELLITLNNNSRVVY